MSRIWLLFMALGFACVGQAHPMDLARLNLRMEGDRLVAAFKLHELAAQRLVPSGASEPNPETTHSLFSSTLGLSVPKLNSLDCLFLRSELVKAPGEADFVILTAIFTCRLAKESGLHLFWEFPFLARMDDTFQLMTIFSSQSESVTLVANRRHPSVEFGESARTFLGFVKMGMGHIGARPEEWRSREGSWQLPDGIDHILFILALVLAGGRLWGLFKTATGFTVGHSLTLALSTYKIIHVHSKWIEVGIAFSIAYVAGRAFFRKGSRAESWILATIFGVVHGLGFSGALQDLELSRSETLTALAGFNVGVELGQIFFIFLMLMLLAGMGRVSLNLETRFRRLGALAICVIGAYWTYYRAFV